MPDTSLPIIIQGNAHDLVIPLQIYVVDDNTMVLQDFSPEEGDIVRINLKSKDRTYNYPPTITDNDARISLTGNEAVGIYAIEVTIVRGADGRQYRSLRTDQFVIIDSSDDLTEDDVVEGLEENIVYINPQLFIAGASGRGITSITLTATAGLVDTYTILYTDGTETTFNVTNGANPLIIVDNLTDGGSTKALSAEMGKVLGERMTDAEDAIAELPEIGRRELLAAGYVTPAVADTYDVGTKLYVMLQQGLNTFTNLKTRQFLVTWQVVALAINSYGKSIAEIVKVAEDDWMLVKIHAEINGSEVTSADPTIGALTGGVFGNVNIGLTNATSAFTIVCNFRTPKTWPNTTTYLFANRVVTLSLYNVRHSILLSSGTTLVESQALEEDTDYKVVASFDGGNCSITIGNVTNTTSGKSLTGTEYYPQIGSTMSAGTSSYPWLGIIKSVKVYNALITDADELDAAYSSNANLILNVQPQTIMPDAWLDLSTKMNMFMPPRETSGRMGVAYGAASGGGGGEPVENPLKNLPKVNLFGMSELVEDSILDGRWGTIGSWPHETKNEYCAVAKIPVTMGKYYVIINPYLLTRVSRIGVMSGETDRGSGDSRDNIIMPSGNDNYPTTAKYVIAHAVYNPNPAVTIDTMTFIAYRVPITYPYPIDVSMIEVYEMDTAADAIAYVNARMGEEKELKDKVNIDRKLLSSPNVGTLTSMLQASSMVIMGDSITANHGWSNYVANKLRWKNTNNIAIGGANISGREDTTSQGTAKRNLIYQIKQMANFLGDVCYSEGELSGGVYTKKMDKVFISMGYNDAHNQFPCGSWDDVRDVAWQDLEPATTSTDFDTIAAAIKYCVNYLRTTIITGTYEVNGSTINTAIDCRDARIIWQTPIPTSADWGNGYGDQAVDQRMKRVEDVITDVCAGLSVPIINGRLQVGFTREECDTYLADGTHPNQAGYVKMGEMNLAGILAGGYPAKMTRRQVIQPTITATWTYVDNGNPFTENQLTTLLDTYYNNWRNEDDAVRLVSKLVDGQSPTNVNTSKAFYAALNSAAVDLDTDGYDLFVASSQATKIRLSADAYVDLGIVNSVNLVGSLPSDLTRTDEFLFTFTVGSSWSSITLPSGVVMADGFDWSEAAEGVVFQVSIMDGVCAYLCVTPNS